MLSTATVAQQYEICLHGRLTDGRPFKHPVDECGLFESREEARQARILLHNWLLSGMWPAEYEAMPETFQEAFFYLKVRLRPVMNVDLATLCVSVQPFPCEGGDNAPFVEEWRTDSGHGAAGCHLDPDDDSDDDVDEPTPIVTPGVAYTHEEIDDLR